VWFVIVAGVLISGLVFGISRVVSRLRDENVLLAQRIAILEFRLQRQPVEGNGVKST
jgi:BMFP domain-containing protein YqiC